jgi:hypothetical protein
VKIEKSYSLEVLDQANIVRLHVEQSELNTIVECLEHCGGDLDAFAKFISNDSAYTDFYIQKRLLEHPDSGLKERWDKAIEIYNQCVMRRLQRKALHDLENMDDSDEKSARIVLAAAKIILGDMLAATTVIAKQKATAKIERSSVLDAIKIEMEGEEDEE